MPVRMLWILEPKSRKEVIDLNESVMGTGPFVVAPMERGGLMEGRQKPPKRLVRGAADPSDFGDPGDSLHFSVSEGQESKIPPLEKHRLDLG